MDYFYDLNDSEVNLGMNLSKEYKINPKVILFICKKIKK